MRLEELKLGKSIEIIVTRDQYRLRLVSKIEDVANDRIAITLITGNGKVFQFQEKDKIEFIYKDDKRLWRWRGLKGTIEKLEDSYVHCLYGPREGEHFNRRNAYRVFVGEEIKFHWIKQGKLQILLDNKEDMESVNEPLLVKNAQGLLKDISETGAGFYSNERLELHDAVTFRLITCVGVIHVIGEVVRITHEGNGNYRKFFGISFVEVSNIINKYVFTLQRIELQKHSK